MLKDRCLTNFTLSFLLLQFGVIAMVERSYAVGITKGAHDSSDAIYHTIPKQFSVTSPTVRSRNALRRINKPTSAQLDVVDSIEDNIERRLLTNQERETQDCSPYVNTECMSPSLIYKEFDVERYCGANNAMKDRYDTYLYPFTNSSCAYGCCVSDLNQCCLKSPTSRSTLAPPPDFLPTLSPGGNTDCLMCPGPRLIFYYEYVQSMCLDNIQMQYIGDFQGEFDYLCFTGCCAFNVMDCCQTPDNTDGTQRPTPFDPPGNHLPISGSSTNNERVCTRKIIILYGIIAGVLPMLA